MVPTRPVLVFIECVDQETAYRHFLAALGLRTPIGRWDMMPAQISGENPCSLDVAIFDFRERDDLTILRSLPGVVRVEVFAANITLPDPMKVRCDINRRVQSSAAA
jgi:hypothetical protein